MANITTNKDIDYVTKDFSSTVEALITFASINYGTGTSANRLWTDFNADSFSRNWLEILAFVADVFFFYFDNQATQSYLQTATIRSYVEFIARQFGFTPETAASASGVVTFTTTGAGTISRGFKLQSSNGQQFYVTSDITSIGAGEVSGNALQGIIKTEFFVAQGLQNEEFELAGPNVIRDLTNVNPLDFSPQVSIGGNDYTLVETFIRQNGEDSDPVVDSLGNVIGGGGRVFILAERSNGIPYIRFGDGLFGRKLAPGETVTVIYRTGGGSAGNIDVATLNTLIDTNPIVSSVTNNFKFSGGTDEQTIDQLRELIPASLRTLERAVTQQDYSDILTANFNEVFAASAEINTKDPGVDINVYVVPQGTGISKISENPTLKSTLSNFLDRRKLVTIQFKILDAFGVDVLISIELFISDTSSKNTIKQAIKTALLAFFDLSTGGVNGTKIQFSEDILLKDIGNIIEDIDGIERYEIKRLTYRPRVEQNIVGLTTTYVNSEVKIFKNIEELEWTLSATGIISETLDTPLFVNTGLIGFTYTSGTGEIVYAFDVDLRKVAPGDIFTDGAAVDFTVLSVDTTLNKITIAEGQTVDNTVDDPSDGSIRNGATSYESFACFKKILGKASNLSIDSITDNNLDISILSGTGIALSSRHFIDNSNVFVANSFATGEYYLVDGANNIWEIEENDDNTLKTSITAVNDASITSVTSGDYSIVKKLEGYQVLFNANIFNIQFNNANTLFSTGAQFNQIGTIGDEFFISKTQDNIGNLGVAVDLISFDETSKEVKLNNSPDLSGVTSEYILVDNSGQIFNISAIDDISRPSVFYDSTNKDTNFELVGTGLGYQIAQGFKVTETTTYAIIGWYLKREGNIVGNLTAKIVADDGSGLPDLSSVIATSNTKNVTDISNSTFEDISLYFSTPPTLTAAIQYHLVLYSDNAYQSSEVSGNFSFSNSSDVAYTYNNISGVVSYASSVDLSIVMPGHYFIDGAGDKYLISSVDDSIDQLVLDTGLSLTQTTAGDGGSTKIYDRILVGLDSSSPSYADGEFSQYDGSDWSNSTLGPSPTGTDQDAIFSVQGAKTIKVDSNLTPSLGTNAIISTRYYDDENQISVIIGLSEGTVTSAPDANGYGLGTVSSIPNRPIDNFVFRTSRYADDIINIRNNELPQLSESDISLDVHGGVD